MGDAEFEEPELLVPMLNDIVSIQRITGAHVDIIRQRNISRIEALGGEHLKWCDELAMNRVLKLKEEIVACGLSSGLCKARVVEGDREDVCIFFSNQEGKPLLSFLEGFKADSPTPKVVRRAFGTLAASEGELATHYPHKGGLVEHHRKMGHTDSIELKSHCSSVASDAQPAMRR